MNTISYLKEIYGYSTPIFLKDIRIGGKSKTSIRKELSRGVENGLIKRDGQGVYYFDPSSDIPCNISYESVVEKRFIKNDYDIPGLDIDVYGYYSGLTFLHQLGLTQQVPAVYEITTNNTSCSRLFKYGKYRTILRKGKTTINRFNYKTLQFFDLFYLLNKDDVKNNYDVLYEYIQNNLDKADFEKYISLYPVKILKLIVEGGLINAFR